MPPFPAQRTPRDIHHPLQIHVLCRRARPLAHGAAVPRARARPRAARPRAVDRQGRGGAAAHAKEGERAVGRAHGAAECVGGERGGCEDDDAVVWWASEGAWEHGIQSLTCVPALTTGLLPILAALQRLYRSPTRAFSSPASSISTLQLLSLLIYYPLEHATYLAGKGVVPLSPARQGRWALWSVRAWAAYVMLDLVALWRRRGAGRGEGGREE